MRTNFASGTNRVWLTVALIVALTAMIAGGLQLWRTTINPAVPKFSISGDAEPVLLQALESARRRVNKRPNSDDEWGLLGMVLAAHGAFEPASQCFARAETLNREEQRWPYFLARTTRDDERTIAALERAVAVGAPEPLPRLVLGEKLLAAGQTDEAGQHFQSVLDADPTEPRALTGKAQVAFSQGNLQDAHAALREAAARAPQVRERLQLLAQVLNRLGRRDDAIATQRRAEDSIESWPDRYYMELRHYEVGSAELGRSITRFEQAGMRDEALAVAVQAIGLHPDNAALHLQHARLVAKMGRQAEAEASLRRALTLGADDGSTYYMLGQSLFWQRRFSEAESTLRDALEREPENLDANLMLGMTLDEVGNKGEAARYYQLVLEIDPGNENALNRLKALRTGVSAMPATTGRDRN